MDNLTHTLIGAALAESGLRRRTRYAAAAMMIGANIPDVDVIAVPLGHSLEWRRGVTHGIPALLLWPFLLTGLIMLWHRWRGASMGPRAGATSRARHERDRPPIRPGQLVLLSAIAVLTHPTYDWLNNYGMRWLMPLDGRWTYGDSLFIIDPYLLAALLTGVVLARRRARAGTVEPFTPGRIAVGAAAIYTIAMFGLHHLATRVATESLGAGSGQAQRMMVAPTPANPFRWRVVQDAGTYYRQGEVRLLADVPFRQRDSVAVGLEVPAARTAASSPEASGFLGWSRWPFFRVDAASGEVIIADLRYVAPEDEGGWASIRIPANAGR